MPSHRTADEKHGGCDGIRDRKKEGVHPIFEMMEKYFPKFCKIVVQRGIPKTTNPVERAIGELEERYQLTKGFTSFYFAQFFIKAFQMY